ncbi:beta strand repeat-containing protein [Bdellovibrio bacteriovorus]|uniref:beta strand repeat-containing protein n=1 Tax=Bdellovibrio bacteriovorus TaxID=959 RepID=UPI003AA8AD6C
MRKRYVTGITVLFLSSWALATPGSLTYQGRIRNAQGEALEVNGVQFEFSITNPTGTCVLYRETSSAIDMRNSSGVFDVPIGTGTKNYPAAAGFKLLDSFDNSVAIPCEGGGSYTPVADDKRLLRVQFHDGTGWKLITPDNEIRSVPYAGHAKLAQSALKLGSNVASDFVAKASLPVCGAGTYLRHIAPAGTFECTAPVVTGANVSGNIAGSSAGFTGNLTGDVSGTQSATSVDRIKGTPVVNTGLASGKVLKFDGTNWAPADDNSGTAGAITSLTGAVSSAGSPAATVTLNDNTVATAKIQDDAVTTGKILNGTILNEDISAAAAIADSKLATISTAGKVSGSAITSGTIGGSTAINTSGLIQTSSGVRLYSGANYVELKAPALSGNSSYELPAADGTNGQLLKTDGAGKLSWTTVTSSGGTVTGVTATAPIASSGGTAPVISLNDSGVTAGTYNRVTVSAKGLVTAASNATATDIPNVAGDVTSTAGLSNTKVEKIQGTAVASATPLLGQVLVYDNTKWNNQYFGFGQLRSTVTGNAQMPTACATANKTLNWSAITDTFSCSDIAISNTQVSGLGTASTKDFGTAAGNLVELDGTGKVPAALLPSVGDNLGNHTATAHLNMASYNITSAGKIYLADGAWNAPSISFSSSPSTGISNSGGIMKFTSGGNLAMDLSATSLTLNGSFGPLMRLGGGSFNAANPTYSFGGYSTSGMFPGTNILGFSVNGTEKLRLASDGMIGVGTTSPTRRLHIVGDGTDYGDDIYLEGVNSETALPQISLTRSRGTTATRNPLLANDTIGTLAFRGWDNTAHAYSARISSSAETDFATAVNGNLRFFTASAGTDAERMRITGAGNVGIGTTTPTVPLQIVTRVPSSAVHPHRAGVQAIGEGTDVGGRISALVASTVEIATFSGYQSAGTLASPLAVSSGQAITSLTAFAYNGTQYQNGGNAAVNFYATEAHTTSAGGAKITFHTTTNGATGASEKMVINHNGNVGIGTTNPTAKLEVNGAVKIGTSAPIGRMTVCSYVTQTGTTVAAYNVHNWTAGECTNGVPNSTCVGYISKGVVSGSENNLAALNPNESVFPGCPGTCTANANGGFGFTTDFATTGDAIYDIRVVYMCQN